MDCGVLCQEKDKIPTDKSEKRNGKLSIQNGFEINDCWNQANDSHNYNTIHRTSSSFHDTSYTNNNLNSTYDKS